MKIAMFGDDSSNFRVIYTEENARFTTLVRLTNWAEVNFEDRAESPEKIEEEIKLIDREMEKTIEDNVQKLKALKARKTAVLSKVFQTEVA
jgi:hypothetical protein